MDLTALQLMLSPKRCKCFQVLVDRPVSKVAAAGHGNISVVEAAQQGAQEIGGGTHGAGQIVGDLRVLYPTGVDKIGVLIYKLNDSTHA